jgi:hypothetical protein
VQQFSVQSAGKETAEVWRAGIDDRMALYVMLTQI